ncbi:acyltransferase family protein [Colwellia psychrerythraea]|uniref:Acyltransferase 3 n=1 Tax=Colwellia psychrerythraea TaxID=28229 RepID=A0A099L1K9_COLPS|nr:acyltransferase [Colwellia psychrerythraea]KGJ96012.1 acyltransferase 3 [Colwellia psychrerythraea]
MRRIDYLDGHRGIAILLVVFFHAFSRWTELVPYGDTYAQFPLFKFGFLGVQLFFLLSGFVILMSLEKSSHFKSFLYRRWLRLFPCMLICSVIIFMTKDIFFERPQGIPSAKDLIPGLTFIEPYILSKLIGSVNSIEGAFWSLYVEFKFYAIAAFLYFLIGSRKLVVSLFILFIFSFTVTNLSNYTDNSLIAYSSSISHHLSFEYFGWFAAGTSFYMFIKHDNKKWFLLGLLMCTTSSLVTALESNSLGIFVAIMAISTLFSYSLVNRNIQKLLSNKFLLFFGYISYPLYLLHENMMISLTIQFKSLLPENISFLLPVLAIVFISSVAYIIAKHIEKPVKTAIADNLLSPIFTTLSRSRT